MKNKIVMVDNSKTYLKHLQSQLEEYFDVWTFSETDSALAFIQEQNPDLLISGTVLKGLKYSDFWDEAKALDGKSTLPILVLSSSNSADVVLNALELGANDFLYKNEDKRLIVAKIKRMVRAREGYKTELLTKRLDTAKQLICTVNHNFNNKLAIAQGKLDKIRREHPETEFAIEEIKELNRVMAKMVKELSDLDALEEIDYTSGTKMFKISG